MAARLAALGQVLSCITKVWKGKTKWSRGGPDKRVCSECSADEKSIRLGEVSKGRGRKSEVECSQS